MQTCGAATDKLPARQPGSANLRCSLGQAARTPAGQHYPAAQPYQARSPLVCAWRCRAARPVPLLSFCVLPWPSPVAKAVYRHCQAPRGPLTIWRCWGATATGARFAPFGFTYGAVLQNRRQSLRFASFGVAYRFAPFGFTKSAICKAPYAVPWLARRPGISQALRATQHPRRARFAGTLLSRFCWHLGTEGGVIVVFTVCSALGRPPAGLSFIGDSLRNAVTFVEKTVTFPCYCKSYCIIRWKLAEVTAPYRTNRKSTKIRTMLVSH